MRWVHALSPASLSAACSLAVAASPPGVVSWTASGRISHTTSARHSIYPDSPRSAVCSLASAPAKVGEPVSSLPPLQPLRLARCLSAGPIVACSVALAPAHGYASATEQAISDPQLRPFRAACTPVPGGIRLASLVSRCCFPPPPPRLRRTRTCPATLATAPVACLVLLVPPPHSVPGLPVKGFALPDPQTQLRGSGRTKPLPMNIVSFADVLSPPKTVPYTGCSLVARWGWSPRACYRPLAHGL